MCNLLCGPLLLAGILTLGCGPGEPTLVPVSGKLTMNGKGIGNVKVEFHPDPDSKTTGPSSTGITDPEGNFTLASGGPGNKPGAVVGMHRVIFSDLDPYGNVFVGRGDYRNDDPKGPKEVPKLPRFPAKNGELANPPYKQEVKVGMPPVAFEIKK